MKAAKYECCCYVLLPNIYDFGELIDVDFNPSICLVENKSRNFAKNPVGLLASVRKTIFSESE